ncbi:methionine ABC transporter permease [Facklamia hominis]|uniref:methionine ABC transporter permease n=1 Tax=Facklamia hominis TaxID=178214 RepID=UPI0038FCC148
MDQIIPLWSKLIGPATLETIMIVSFTALIGCTIGFLLAMLLILWGPNGLTYNKKLYNLFNTILNLIRSMPLLILIIALIPVTRAVIGSIIGMKATIFTLSIACSAFTAKMFEGNFLSVNKQVIEAARSYGATDLQIFFKVIVRQCLPQLINSVTLTVITYIAGSTIASSIGGGGLGAVAITYGYQSFNQFILYYAVVVLIILVNIVQFIGDLIYKKVK